MNIPNLGSHILAIIRRRLPDDWTERYNTTPVLIENLRRDPALHRSAVYRASGWTRVGLPPRGAGATTRDIAVNDKPKKDVWLRLDTCVRDWKRMFNQYLKSAGAIWKRPR